MKKIFLVSLIFSVQLIAQNELKLLTNVHGEKEGDRFSSVDAIGDVDGDGYDDFIVGATNIGEYVKLYFGGSPFDTLNCIKFLHGTRKIVYASGCGKGDLNGDGYNDFIINTMYDVNDYRVEIYYGGKNKKIYDNPDLTITNNGWYYYFRGKSITGDLNGDGYDDLVITAPNDDYDARGRVYIYYGGKEMDTNVDVYLEGKPWDNFGNSASIVGDVNGDGFDDLLIGAPQIVKTGLSGKADLFFGGSIIGFDNCIEFVGDSTAKGYGKIVSGLGDINGDGINDFGIVSGKYIDVYSGKTLKTLFRITQNKKNWYPLNISGRYDLNKDGLSDFIVSYAHEEDQYSGGVALYLGSKELNTIPKATISGKNEDSYFGSELIIGGDINNDGLPEILIGEEGELTQNGIIGSGTVFIYSYNILNGIESSPVPTVPVEYKLYSNYPNPFNPTTKIQYNLYKELEITIDVMNLAGEKIKTLFSGQQFPGIHSVIWNGTDTNNLNVASGIYFLRFTTKSITGNYSKQQEIIKMVLMK